MKPRVLVIGLGGTWCMRQKKNEVAHVFSEYRAAETLGEQFAFGRAFPAIEAFARATFVELEALDSSNMRPSHWSRVASYISTHSDEHDAFVILQGTDTLAFTAASLAFALHGLGKAVVLTGAQLAMDVPGSDAHANVVNACRVAAWQDRGRPVLREVAVVFGSKIIRGTRCRKYSEHELEAFDSVNVPPIGRIRTSLSLESHLLLGGSQRRTRFVAAPSFDARVAMLTVYPGMDPDVITAVGVQSSGLVLAAFGAGNIPSSSATAVNDLSLESSIADLVRQEKPVIVTTQCVTGMAEIGRYETGSKAQEAGAIIANDMTPEAAFVKLAWLLANQDRWPSDARRAVQGKPGRIRAIARAMLWPYAGEITANKLLFRSES
jgi:L-asparaginase